MVPTTLEPRKIYRHQYFDFDLGERALLIAGQKVPLTRTEARLLTVLAEHSDRTLSRDFLTSEVWGGNDESLNKELKLYIYYLRKKFREGRPGFNPIETNRELGFRLIGKTEIIPQQGDQLVEEKPQLPPEIEKPVFHHEHFDFDEQESKLIVGGQTLQLTRNQRKVMSLLTGNQGRVLSRYFFIDNVWEPGYTWDAHNLKSYIFRLRKKLSTDQKDGKEIIKTVRFRGYELI